MKPKVSCQMLADAQTDDDQDGIRWAAKRPKLRQEMGKA